MANSYLNIVTFLCTTLLYYFGIKKNLTYDIFSDSEKYKEYMKTNYMNLAIYLLLVMVVQFIINAYIISNTCGGNISENIGASGVFTFIPWTLIFGVIILVLTVFPGFKSAFSDVVGYFYVSGPATKILNDLLVNQSVQKNIDAAVESSKEEKESMQAAADAIIKIFGNASILINQIVPTNFNDYWNILTPLMKPQYQQPGLETNEIKNKLFDLTVTRDNIGEAMWYLYTGILLTSIVQLKINSRGCVNTPQTMQENQKAFLEEQRIANEKREKAESTTYTITG